MNKFANKKNNSNDSCSFDRQIILLSAKMEELTDHIKYKPEDLSSRLALLGLVGQRRRLLNYLRSIDMKRYQVLISELQLNG